MVVHVSGIMLNIPRRVEGIHDFPVCLIGTAPANVETLAVLPKHRSLYGDRNYGG
jgi:hypothetical protein